MKKRIEDISREEDKMEEINEIWKDVLYENLNHYEVSNLGNIRIKLTKKLLKQNVSSNYSKVCLHNKNIKKCINIHRLVASIFIHNPNKLKIVNHKDGNKLNNNVNNLEWTTQSDNVKHSMGNDYVSPSNKAIYRIDDDGNKVKYISATIAAQQNNISRKMIRKCLKGGQLKSAGYKWEYYENKHQHIIPNLSQMIQIPSYDYYYINNKGEIYSNYTKQFLNITINIYTIVNLQKNNKGFKFAVHRLVAEVFIPNPNKLKIVNHKDGNKLNYCVDNLEWTTYSENTIHAHQTGLIKKFTKKINRIDSDGNQVEYNSITEAATKNNLKRTTLQGYIKNNKIYDGYIWKYREDDDDEKKLTNQ